MRMGKVTTETGWKQALLPPLKREENYVRIRARENTKKALTIIQMDSESIEGTLI
jgi:hypothetical protein